MYHYINYNNIIIIILLIFQYGVVAYLVALVVQWFESLFCVCGLCLCNDYSSYRVNQIQWVWLLLSIFRIISEDNYCCITYAWSGPHVVLVHKWHHKHLTALSYSKLEKIPTWKVHQWTKITKGVKHKGNSKGRPHRATSTSSKTKSSLTGIQGRKSNELHRKSNELHLVRIHRECYLSWMWNVSKQSPFHHKIFKCI